MDVCEHEEHLRCFPFYRTAWVLEQFLLQNADTELPCRYAKSWFWDHPRNERLARPKGGHQTQDSAKRKGSVEVALTYRTEGW